MKRWSMFLALSACLSIPALAADWNGYIVDSACAGNKAMWENSACVARCVRRGNAVVLATEDGKVYKIANQDKVKADTYGKKVTVTGKLEGETISVEDVKM